MPGVLLGSIQFQQREVPDRINLGGKQILAIHRLMGGTRVIDALGPEPEPIKWSGLFYGNAASVRARQCDALRQSGSQVNLSWGTFNYSVVVSDFHADYKHEWEVRYAISCEVISDLNAAGGAAIPVINLFTDDFAEISVVSDATPAIPAIQGSFSVTPQMITAIDAAETAVNAANETFVSISDASLMQLQPAILAAQAALTALEANTNIPAGISLDAITPTSTLDGINAFVSETTLQAAESDIQTALGYMGRIVGNLTTQGG